MKTKKIARKLTGKETVRCTGMVRFADVAGRVWWIRTDTVLRIVPPYGGQGFGSMLVVDEDDDQGSILLAMTVDECAAAVGWVCKSNDKVSYHADNAGGAHGKDTNDR